MQPAFGLQRNIDSRVILVLGFILQGPSSRRRQATVISGIAPMAAFQLRFPAMFPTFSAMGSVPQPDVVRIPVAYAMPRGDHELVNFVSSWVELKKSDGTIESLYDHWILGKTAVRKQPRWSVTRDLLHWVE